MIAKFTIQHILHNIDNLRTYEQCVNVFGNIIVADRF